MQISFDTVGVSVALLSLTTPKSVHHLIRFANPKHGLHFLCEVHREMQWQIRRGCLYMYLTPFKDYAIGTSCTFRSVESQSLANLTKKRCVNSTKTCVAICSSTHHVTRRRASLGVAVTLAAFVARLRSPQLQLTTRLIALSCFLARTAEHDALAQGWRNREARVELVVPYLDARLGLALVQTPDLVAQPGEI
jgi:hypothetical protein